MSPRAAHTARPFARFLCNGVPPSTTPTTKENTLTTKSNLNCPARSTDRASLRVTDPAGWWRRLCFPINNLAISGDLATPVRSSDTDTAACLQLDEWVGAGITDIVDARREWHDEAFVAAHAPQLRYHFVPTNDDGRGQSDEWFDLGVGVVLGALADPDRKVLVHCHMGVNRGPSLAYAAMLALGHDPVEALQAIRDSRPIAAVAYATDALGWWHRRFGETQPNRSYAMDLINVTRWMMKNPVDIGWIISRIRVAEAA